MGQLYLVFGAGRRHAASEFCGAGRRREKAQDAWRPRTPSRTANSFGRYSLMPALRPRVTCSARYVTPNPPTPKTPTTRWFCRRWPAGRACFCGSPSPLPGSPPSTWRDIVAFRGAAKGRSATGVHGRFAEKFLRAGQATGIRAPSPPVRDVWHGMRPRRGAAMAGRARAAPDYGLTPGCAIGGAAIVPGCCRSRPTVPISCFGAGRNAAHERLWGVDRCDSALCAIGVAVSLGIRLWVARDGAHPMPETPDKQQGTAKLSSEVGPRASTRIST